MCEGCCENQDPGKLRPKIRKLRPPYFLYFCPSGRHFSNLQPPAFIYNSTVYPGVYHLLSIPLVNFKVIAKKETENIVLKSLF